MKKRPAAETELALFDGACTLRWLGANCLLIKTHATSLLVDPHFSRPRLRQMAGKISPCTQIIQKALRRLNLSHLDGILVTHTHFDHFMDAFETARLLDADLYGSESVLNARSPEQFTGDIHVVEPGVRYGVGAIQVIFYRSNHMEFPWNAAHWGGMSEVIEHPLRPPARVWEYRSGTVYNLLLEMGGNRLVIQGSAGLPDERSPTPAADVLVLGIGALGLKNRRYCRRWFDQTILQSRAGQVYLSHWDDFFRPWDGRLRDLIGTGRAMRLMRVLSKPYPHIKIERLPPG